MVSIKSEKKGINLQERREVHTSRTDNRFPLDALDRSRSVRADVFLISVTLHMFPGLDMYVRTIIQILYNMSYLVL